MGSTPIESDKPVTFLNAAGQVISNDPRHTEQLSREDTLAKIENMGKETLTMDEIRRALGSANVGPVVLDASDVPQRDYVPGNPPGVVPPVTPNEDSDENVVDYGKLSAQELKDEVDRRELDRSKLTKKSELVALLQADDHEA